MLKEIRQLEKLVFNVPNYQRGYRWGKREVIALLEDILDFQNLQSSDFYCLQPIVVKRGQDNSFNVIDGQQRLTTIFLILKFLKKENFFTITYQTREKSRDFLENIDMYSNIDPQESNIDFFHFSQAFKYIQEFFNEKVCDLDNFSLTFKEKCKVLWYEVQDNEIEVFIRLNTGKIPLLESENIKALFLAKSEDVDSEDLKERAEVWFQAEVETRENADFRYGVLQKINPHDIENRSLKEDMARIEVYFRAIANAPAFASDKEDLYSYFYDLYKKKELNREWDKLQSAISTLKTFASEGPERVDREIFHYLGFLVLCGETIDVLYGIFLKERDRNIFRDRLLERIGTKMTSVIDEIENLNYSEGKKDQEKLFQILLLFNIEFLIAQDESNRYFKFNRFQLERWSLEHIYAQNSKSVVDCIKRKNEDEIRKWLEEVKAYMKDENKKLVSKIDKLKDFSKDGLEDILDEIDQAFEESVSLNSIQNLTLLDRISNSEIGNEIFSSKRLKIQKLGEEERLIPIATQKVFEKYFSSEKTDPNFFTKEDQKSYKERIINDLKKYRSKK